MDRVFCFFKTVFKTVIYIAIGIIVVLRAYDVAVAESNEIGVITVDQLNVRAQPGVENPSLMQIPKGAKVSIIEHQQKWLKIEYKKPGGLYSTFKTICAYYKK